MLKKNPFVKEQLVAIKAVRHLDWTFLNQKCNHFICQCLQYARNHIFCYYLNSR